MVLIHTNHILWFWKKVVPTFVLIQKVENRLCKRCAGEVDDFAGGIRFGAQSGWVTKWLGWIGFHGADAGFFLRSVG